MTVFSKTTNNLNHLQVDGQELGPATPPSPILLLNMSLKNK